MTNFGGFVHADEPNKLFLNLSKVGVMTQTQMFFIGLLRRSGKDAAEDALVAVDSVLQQLQGSDEGFWSEEFLLEVQRVAKEKIDG